MACDIFDKDISKKLREYKIQDKSDSKFHISKQSRKFKTENIRISHKKYLTDYNKIIQNNKDKIKNKYEKMINKVENDETKIKQLKAKMKNEIIKQNKIMVSRTFCIYPTNKQKQKLQEWNNECIKVYNKCVEKYNKEKDNFDTKYMKQKLLIFKELYNNGKKPAPYDILTDVVNDFCGNIKSCKSNKNVKQFEFNKRDKNKQNTWSILIPNKSINKKGIFIRILKNMKYSKEGIKLIKQYGTNHDCRLVYNKNKDRYYIKLPILIDTKIIKKRSSICALDPGEKVFITYYSTKDAGFIGEDMRKILLKIRSKISLYQRLQKKKPEKKENIQIKINKLFMKMKNIVKELHNKCALYLVRNYNKILVPEFKTQYMISRKQINNKIKKIFETEKNKEKLREKLKQLGKQRKLSKKVKFVLNQLSHYKFKQHLRAKCLEYGCEFIDCTEEYTSKTCSNCGMLNKEIKERTLICSFCKKKINRDINGSKNILMKYLKGVKPV